jgi:hypothetical protein
MPLPRGATSLPQPAQHIEGLARLGFQGEGRWVDPHHDVCLLAHRRGHTAAIAIAAVRHNDFTSMPPISLQVFPATAVRDTDLVHPAGQEVVGQMQPPVVPGATGLAEGARVHQHEAARWAGTRQRGRLWSSHQLAQEPEQPVVADAQALTPGRLREVGEPG